MCQVCDNPQRASIERDIRAGLTPSPVAKKYGLRHHAVVIQHERRHMHDTPAVLGIVEYESIPRPGDIEFISGVDIELVRVDDLPAPIIIDIVEDERSSKHTDIELARVLDVSELELLDIIDSQAGMSQLKLLLPSVRRAFRLADGDRSMQERMRFLVNEAIQMDEMGL